MSKTFESEAELVQAFCSTLTDKRPEYQWTAYHETAGWDLLLVHNTGVQVGIEAKLSLNAKVLEQALPGKYCSERGPDYRAILVPDGALQHHLHSLAFHVGIAVLTVRGDQNYRGRISYWANPSLPNEGWSGGCHGWPNWCPAERCTLPDYIPDVTGGHASPVALTQWKIKAIKLLILLERNGAVTRADMKTLQISPSRWTDHYNGFLTADPIKGGYVRNRRTPDLKSQHPTNWPEIEADFDAWSKGLSTPSLFENAA